MLAFGAFNASGTDTEHPTGANSGTGLFQFPNGTVSTSHSANPGGTSSFNPATCTSHFTGSGVFKLTGGSGAYKGIDGHGTYNVDGTVVSAHTATGCSKQPVGALVIIKAVGPVSFG